MSGSVSQAGLPPTPGAGARAAFDVLHPAFAAAYFAVVLVFCMAAFHPAFIAASAVFGLAYSMRWRGARPALSTLAWQVPLALVVACANALFAGTGSTLLLAVGPFPVYLESFAYGLCMGLLLVSTMLWFSNAAQVLSSDKVMGLFGGRMPVVGLMISMVMRLVPQFVRRGALISEAASAATSARRPNEGAGLFLQEGGAGCGSPKPVAAVCEGSGGAVAPPSDNPLAARVRQMSVLMGWSMEDSLETADAMRARGWGACSARTTYRQRDFRGADGAAVAALAVLAVVCAWCAVAACAACRFYPVVEAGGAAFALPYVVLLCVPAILEVREWAVWR